MRDASRRSGVTGAPPERHGVLSVCAVGVALVVCVASCLRDTTSLRLSRRVACRIGGVVGYWGDALSLVASRSAVAYAVASLTRDFALAVSRQSDAHRAEH